MYTTLSICLLGSIMQDIFSQNNQVIELSDDDDPEVMGRCDENENDVDKTEEDEVQAEFCELRDAENLPDTEGRICIRRGATEAESFYLAPHIARVIKPHQVTSSIMFT